MREIQTIRIVLMAQAITVTTQTEYRLFEDWDSETQKKLLEFHADINIDHYWSEPTIYNLKERLKCFGLNIGKIFFQVFGTKVMGPAFRIPRSILAILI